MILGSIGDDFTGSSDLGLMLAAGGMATVQYVGVPDGTAEPGIAAGVVALKSRSVPPKEAVEQSLSALAWLKGQGCRQYLFKYCSTFDSTPDGNIGPVIDALVDALGTADPVIVCPAFPATGRTIYQGHLFVGDRLLNESGMESHPLTPMTDPDIRRWLRLQTKRQIGHVGLVAIRAGRAREALLAEAAAGRQIAVCDAIEDADLKALGAAARDFELITGGSGIALGLPEVHGASPATAPVWRGEAGPALALSGSCSSATRDQIARHREAGEPLRKVEVEEVIEGRDLVDELLGWARQAGGVPLIYTSDDPDAVKAVQTRFGRERSAEAVEGLFGALARAAVADGFRRIISAGGETSGAVVGALDARALEIGPMIDPGVPALRVSGRDLVLALKSGNFGASDFFAKAGRILGGP